MEIGKKTIVAAVGLFFLGGLSVYLLMANTNAPAQPATTQHKSAVMQEALQQVRASANAQEQEQIDQPAPAPDSTSPAATGELTHEAFLAQAEARREERLIDKEEADRLAKLKAMKERSVECKFWKQQQKTSSAAAKVEEKINEHCNLPSSSTESESSTASENTPSSTASENITE
jgi:hypothetical protein